jgi:pyrimidine operon attenuation protein/uracil phosphoribosyltransferase
MSERNYILDKATSARKLRRMALELAEQLNGDLTPLVVLGIRNSGTVIAEQIAGYLREYISNDIQIALLSLNKTLPVDVEISTSIDLNGVHVLITDDVTNSGKTLLYALKPLLQFYPKSIQTLVLVERMHKLFPVKPDFVGLSVATTIQEHIQVEVKGGAIEGAYIS